MFSESITPKEMEKLDYASFPGKIYVIDSVGAEFNRAIAYLRSQKIIGFDTETRPTFSQDQPRYGVALLQLSGPDKAFLFRINKMGMHRRLCNLLASDKVIRLVQLFMTISRACRRNMISFLRPLWIFRR